ncbi:DNA-3-methyladenine glycosylase 2 family protein [Micromonospora arborensis]|uniref:DNA-3-methyladenine glycosylase 2 family protein n=1 Tax=Micromonospora arborensis TaxID=2116518 RepID=UPI0037174447
MELDFERCYRAVDSRDQRFDGWFYTGVTSTGIYCRPSCPAITPKRKNVRFFPSAAAAQGIGLRACRRCRPDAAPGSPLWDVRADVVGRAMRLIADGVVDRDGVPGLASRLGYTERHLHRMLSAEMGAGPLALARAQRAQTARILIETTGLPMAEIAFAAGFGSIRQFNDTLREVYASAPSDLRTARGRQQGPTGAGTIALRLAYRPPLHAQALLDFLAVRALPGVDEVRDGTYHRGLRLPHGTGQVALTPADGHVAATLRLVDLRDLAPAVARCRRLLDLDADPAAIDATLAADPALAPAVAAEPGIRVPRAVDGFEMAVRAIIGQQVSVTSAQKSLTRLLPTPTPDRVDHEVIADGDGVSGQQPHDHRGEGGPGAGGVGGLRGFLSAEDLLVMPDSGFGMPAARRETLRGLARAVVDGSLDLAAGVDREDAVRRLLALPGIGPWTANYLAMRAFGDPDVLLSTDLAVRRGAAALGLPDTPTTLDGYAERWRPWRSYATIRLWRAA